MRLSSKNHVILVSNWALTEYRTSFIILCFYNVSFKAVYCTTFARFVYLGIGGWDSRFVPVVSIVGIVLCYVAKPVRGLSFFIEDVKCQSQSNKGDLR